MKLITIEGMDYIGKTTLQQNLIPKLKEKLGDIFEDVIPIKFPYYNSPTGKIIQDYLNDKSDNKESIYDYYYITNLYMLNRLEFFRDNPDLINRNVLLLADRYTLSNIIHHMSHHYTEERFHKYDTKSFSFIKNRIWEMIEAENVINQLPSPKICIYLMPESFDFLLKCKASRNDEADRLEEDDRLKETYEFYTQEKVISAIVSRYSYFYTGFMPIYVSDEIRKTMVDHCVKIIDNEFRSNKKIKNYCL